MPCAGLSGVEYVDAVVKAFYRGSYAAALEDFIMDADNVWCPKWIKRNYEIRNKFSEDAAAAPHAQDAVVPLPPARPDDDASSAETTQSPALDSDGKRKFPFSKESDITWDFPPDAEPPGPEDPEREEEHGTDYHHWDKKNRETWQLHSMVGPNINAEGRSSEKKPVPFEELVNPSNPEQPYDRHWNTFPKTETPEKWWHRLRAETSTYEDESLNREGLGDDYQQLFVTMVLDHVLHVFECLQKKTQPEPLRLLLLGTAGSGKTRSVQTLLQEILRALRRADLP